MKASELRERTDEELKTNLRELEEEVFKLRLQMVTGQLDNLMLPKGARRTIARIHTLLRERELAGDQ
ncbi:MAG: 50S ribosomal protein L29 [Nitrospinae bacterium]|nr:50S ribosomal protein L29 [Nitrospinota bacterium]